MKSVPPCAFFYRRGYALALGILTVVLLPALFRYHERVGAQGSAGSLSFAQSNVSVAENGGSAAITLTRTGGSSGRVTARVSLTDITTSPADYVLKPGSPDLGFPAQQFNFSFFGTQSIALQRDGKIILAPSRVRLNANGSVDSTFNAPAFNSLAHSAAVQADGKIVFIGGFTTVGGVRKNGVVRLNSDGSLDTSFDVGAGTSNANVVAFQSDGKILIAGIFTDFGGAPNSQYVVRLNTDGSLDTTFVKGTNVSSTYSLAVQPDGKILMGGWGLARLNPDGSLDNSFNCQLGAVILSLVLQPDGKILAAGNFDHFGSQAIYNIARINTDGSLDTSFNTGSGPDSGVSTIALQPDGKIVIGGSFDSINGTFRSKIARLNSDGIVDSTFDGIGSVSGTRVEALLMQDDGKLMASGFFSFTTTPVNYKMVGRLNGDLFATWNDGDSADKTINLSIVDDSLQESNETLNLMLAPLSGATAGAITSATLTINDNDVAPAFTSGPPPQGITKTAYSHMFTATGSPAPTFSSTSTLPPGLFLQTSGLLSGTPTAAGTFSITVSAANGIAPPATQTFSITILSGGIIQFSSSAFSVTEGAGPIVVTVTRTGGTAGTTGVSYSTNGGTAGSNTDFTQTSGTLTFADGETSKTLSVPIINDVSDENDETFAVTLNSITGSGSLGPPTTSTITIQDEDPPPTVTIADSVQLEPNSGTRTIAFAIRLSAPSGKTISFNYATTDGTASAGTDFVGASGNAQMFPGTMVFSLPLNITGDTAVEPDEIFTITLTNFQNATPARTTANATIIGDDNGAGNPIDLQGFLVFLHYSDFLGRAPDADGFNFWKGTITQCGSDAGCIEVQRVAASASFFLSIEFKETGYLVERIYKSSFGDATGNSTFPSAHQVQAPIVRLNEFLTDTTTIGQGVVVLQPGWEQALETNKQTFLNNFVLRTRFLIDYPANMPAAAFVDKLNQRAGYPLSQSERDQLVNDLSTSAKTRAQVLRAVAEHQNLINAEFNRAFVLMQYFGYLRRNPNDSPDGDYTGYDFWLTKLNQFNGNYIEAEMVKAFLSSIEYRKRFGP